MPLPELLSGAVRLIRLAPPLWPGFVPQDTPLIVFDGQLTWLIGTEPQDDGWQTSGDAWYWQGQHPCLVANTAVTLPGGRVAAGLLLPTLGDVAASTVAALLIHEAFHVYQSATPSAAWEAHELDALTYPVGDDTVLHARAEETSALAAALTQADWEESARRALYWRRVRHGLLRPEHRTFETRMDTTEGLAAFVETRFMNTLPVLDVSQAAGLPARQWAYFSGAALAHLLSRTDTDWPGKVLDGTPLDRLLAAMVGDFDGCPVPDPTLRESALRTVQRRLDQLQEVERSFQTQAGQRLNLRSSRGLQVTGFDPMNIDALGNGRTLHRRYLHLQVKDVGPLTMTGGQALTCGPSLLRVTQLDLRGLPDPVISGDLWSVQDDHWQISLPGALVQWTADGWVCVVD